MKDFKVPTAFCIDKTRKLIYLAHGYGQYKILSARLDGSIISTLFEGKGGVSGIAVNEKTGQLFWTEYDSDPALGGRIRALNADGSGARVVLDNLEAVGPIVVSERIGSIFWVEHRMGVGRIHRSHLDGTSHKVFRDIGGANTTLAVDDLEGKLYWLNNGTLVGIHLSRSKFDGSEMENVPIKNLKAFAFTLDPYERKIYFDSGGGYNKRSLFYVRLSNSGTRQLEPISIGVATGQQLSLAIFNQQSVLGAENTKVINSVEISKGKTDSGVRFELDNCKAQYGGHYRHVTGHVTNHIDLSSQAAVLGLLAQAASYATHYCRSENDNLANIAVDIFQDGRADMVVHALNYDKDRLNWFELENRFLREKQRNEEERMAAERSRIELEEKRKSVERIARAAYTDQGLANANNIPNELFKLLNIEVAKEKEFQACHDGCKYMDGVAASECITGCRDFEVYCNTSIGNFSRADRANGITEGRYIGITWLRYGPPSIPGGMILHSEPPKWNEHRSVFKFLRANGSWVKQEMGIWGFESCPR